MSPSPLPALPDIGKLIAAIETGVTQAIGRDIRTVSGFAADQVESIAQLAKLLSKMTQDGKFKNDPEGLQDHLNILQGLITGFATTLRGLEIIMVEKAWNAAVKVVWDALNKATGLTLPRPAGLST